MKDESAKKRIEQNKVSSLSADTTNHFKISSDTQQSKMNIIEQELVVTDYNHFNKTNFEKVT